jgi:hypothetical protein
VNPRIVSPLAVLVLGVLVVLVACGDSEENAGASSSGSSGTSSSGASGTSGAVPGPGTFHAGCRVYPNDNAWNTDVSKLPVDTALMQTIMPKMSPNTKLHPDWGTDSDGYGIPITAGKAATPVPITFNTGYGEGESDKLPCPSGGGEFCYPIPSNARVEGGGDTHILFLATDNAPEKCVLYELFAAHKEGGGWSVGSAAIWKLDTNALRPEGWTSADAAGLSILAGLVRREELARGEITHALRFTMDNTQHAYIHPATHAAGQTDAALPPMGLRLRLKAEFPETGFSGPSLVILKAMKKYGVILADNGSDWYVSGEMSEDWRPDMDGLVEQMAKIEGSDFEIVKTGNIIPQE